MGIASRTLKQNGLADQAKKMCDRIRESGDYYKALGVIGEYVNITSVDDAPDEGEDFEEGMGISVRRLPTPFLMPSSNGSMKASTELLLTFLP